jgi:hypothetical protein
MRHYSNYAGLLFNTLECSVVLVPSASHFSVVTVGLTGEGDSCRAAAMCLIDMLLHPTLHPILLAELLPCA